VLTTGRTTRVALVTHGFAEGGGVPTVCRWLAAALASTGRYDVDVHDLATSSVDAASRRAVRPSSWWRHSVRTVREDPVRHHHWGADAVEIEAMRYRPRRELTETLGGYDLVQVVAGSPAWALPVLGCGPPVILQAATLVTWERAAQLAADRTVLRWWRAGMTVVTARLETTALRRASAVLVENDEMLRHVRSTGQTRAYKVPPGTDTRAFTPSPDGWRGEGHLLTVCRLADPRKRLDVLVRAYRHLVDQDGSTPPLVLAGRGSLSSPVSDLIGESGLTGRVTVCSDVARADLIRLYQEASVFVQASSEEGLGLSVLEAMACGLPVVATATHGTRETVADGETGWLVDLAADDLPRVIAERVRLARTGAGARAGRSGRARCVAEFSTDACVSRFLEIYDGMCRSRRAALP
jgi:glycosyltransferase involved in cell wall biosynthesis